MRYSRVLIVGLGYIGLPTATMFAVSGVEVIGNDILESIVATVNSGRSHLGEPTLDRLLAQAVNTHMLHASTEPEPADAFIIAVPTPFKADHQPDISYVESAARRIAPVLAKGNLVVLESTSPIGTTELMAKWLAEERPDLKFPSPGVNDPDVYIAYCPERVLPGRIIKELVGNARTIGGLTPECGRRAIELYKVFVRGDCTVTTARMAEMAKLVENSFRDVNIAFANELSVICDKLGIDVWELREIANQHPRVNILEPGAGVGGHCIAVDPWFIVAAMPEEARLIRTAREVNDAKPYFIVDKVKRVVAGFDHKPVIACFGLSYKPNVRDLRESPAIKIVHMLGKESVGTILVVEDHVCKLPDSLNLPDVRLVSLPEALAKADVLVLLVDHAPFKALEQSSLAGKIIVDARGIWRSGRFRNYSRAAEGEIQTAAA